MQTEEARSLIKIYYGTLPTGDWKKTSDEAPTTRPAGSLANVHIPNNHSAR